MKKRVIFLVIFIGFKSILLAQSKIAVYYIAGQGADQRLFKNLKLDSSKVEVKHIFYEIPDKKETLPQYAKRLSNQITHENFILIGTSLGGMIATEISDFMLPKKTIVVSSAKCRDELPFRYRFQKAIPIYAIFPPKIIKLGALILQPIVEPDRKSEKEIFKSMLKNKNPYFLKRTIFMITHWERSTYRQNIIHIHGDNDHTIPHRNVELDYLIKNGSHMMTLTQSEEINRILNYELGMTN